MTAQYRITESQQSRLKAIALFLQMGPDELLIKMLAKQLLEVERIQYTFIAPRQVIHEILEITPPG